MAVAAEPVPGAVIDAVSDSDGAFRVGRNFSFRFVAQVLSSLINVGAMVMLGNALSASDYGSYAFYYALIALVASLADGGVGLITTREIARHRSEGPRLLGDALMVKGVISTTLLAVVTTLAFSTLHPAQALLVTLVAATGLVDFSQDPSVWVLRAHERLNLEAVLLVVSQVVWVAVLAGSIAARAGIDALLASATIAFAVRLAVGLLIVSRVLYRPRFVPDLPRLKRLLLAGLPLGLAMSGVVLYGRVGLLVLRGLSTRNDVAYYNVAYLLSQPFGFIATTLGVAAFPLLSRHARRGEPSLRRALRRTYKVQLLVAPPLTVGLFLLAEPIIGMLFHKGQLQPAAAGLRIMSLALTLTFLNLTSRFALTAMDRQSKYLKGIIGGLIASVVLGLVLVPSMGYIGACIAALGGELTIWLVCQRSLASYVRVRDLLADLWKPVVAAAGMGVAMLLLRDANVWITAGAGGVTYVALLLLIHGLSGDELRMIGRLATSMGLPGVRASRPELHI